jgi:integrase
VATLVFAGPRISEALALRWRDVDLASGRLTIAASKTDAGVRTIDLLPVLRDELASHRAQARRTGGDDLVFAPGKGDPLSAGNIRRRVLSRAVELANEAQETRGLPPLPEGITPHGLRHTFASLLIAKGEDPAYVMTQLGHTDATFTLTVYTHAMRRRDGERERLRALVEGCDWAVAGTSAPAGTLTVAGVGVASDANPAQ